MGWGGGEFRGGGGLWGKGERVVGEGRVGGKGLLGKERYKEGGVKGGGG